MDSTLEIVPHSDPEHPGLIRLRQGDNVQEHQFQRGRRGPKQDRLSLPAAWIAIICLAQPKNKGRLLTMFDIAQQTNLYLAETKEVLLALNKKMPGLLATEKCTSGIYRFGLNVAHIEGCPSLIKRAGETGMNIALGWDGALALIASLKGTSEGKTYGADNREKAIATLRNVIRGPESLRLPTGAGLGWFYIGGTNHRTFVIHGRLQDGSDIEPYMEFEGK